MRKMKFMRISVLMIMLVGISCSVFAAETVNLDLQTAVNMALKSNLDYKIATINYEKSKLQYQKQKANYLLQQSRYNELENEISLNTAENTYQGTKDQLISDVISEYSNIWLSKLDLEIKEKNAKLESLKLDESQAQYKIGDIGSVDLLEQENTSKDAQYSLENARDDYQQDCKEFKTDLNIVDQNEISLADLQFNSAWQITEDKAIETALKNSVDLRLEQEQLELAQIDSERAKISAAELDQKIKAKSAEAAKLEKEKAEKDLKTSTQEAYYQFKQALKDIELNNKRLSEAEQNYKLRKEQYNAGLITKIEVLDYEVNMLQAKYNYLSSIATYYQKDQSLRQQMGLESGVWENETAESK